MHPICGPFVLKTIIMNYFAFRETLVLCHSLIRSSYFIQVYIFIPLIHPALFLRFSHILLTPILTMRNSFLFSDDAVDQRKLGI